MDTSDPLYEEISAFAVICVSDKVPVDCSIQQVVVKEKSKKSKSPVGTPSKHNELQEKVVEAFKAHVRKQGLTLTSIPFLIDSFLKDAVAMEAKVSKVGADRLRKDFCEKINHSYILKEDKHLFSSVPLTHHTPIDNNVNTEDPIPMDTTPNDNSVADIAPLNIDPLHNVQTNDTPADTLSNDFAHLEPESNSEAKMDKDVLFHFEDN